jgi:hypothetical protein
MRPNRFHMLSLFCAAAAAALAVQPARANFIFNIEAVTASGGSTGNVVDVTLTNTGADQTIGGFSFGISAASPNITFTGAFTSTTTAPYIFAGDSLFGPEIDNLSMPGTSLGALDIFDITDSGTNVTTGETVGLGQVFFDVAPGASVGPIIATFNADQNSLSDQFGNPIPLAPTPEPSTLVLFTASLVGLAGCAWRRRRCIA